HHPRRLGRSSEQEHTVMERKHRTRGQALTEFALVMPVLMLLMLGIIDFGRALFGYAMASNSLRQALRNAEVFGYNGVDINYTDCALMRDLIRRSFFVGTPTISIQFEKAKSGVIIPCSGSAIDPALLENGDMLQVVVSNSIHLITPGVSQIIHDLNFDF